MNNNTDVQIRLLTTDDDSAMANIIRHVSAEFGFTEDKGYGVADIVSTKLSQLYQNSDSRYWVIEHQGQLVGGAGISSIGTTQFGKTCELQKMYFSSSIRGKGLGKQLAAHCLQQANILGFDACYLETTQVLVGAYQLYKKLGFKDIDCQLGNTGHDNCEIWMVKTL
ncbi:MAG: GNAT family N-acetyltransferase [Parashewanella sp.]